MLIADFIGSRAHPLAPAAPPRPAFHPRADAYPMYLIEIWQTADGAPITIRPIDAGDMALERAFLNGLSEQTRYQRLFSTRRLLPGELKRLTHIDYEHEMALIAITFLRGFEQQIGVARYVKEADGDCDFAIVIADAWQRSGLGEKLLRSLMHSARLAGITRLTGITLATNTGMQRLARRLGFELRHDPGDATVIRLIKPL
jgi:GNAT superfamily N-acetyltransferase